MLVWLHFYKLPAEQDTIAQRRNKSKANYLMVGRKLKR